MKTEDEYVQLTLIKLTICQSVELAFLIIWMSSFLDLGGFGELSTFTVFCIEIPVSKQCRF